MSRLYNEPAFRFGERIFGLRQRNAISASALAKAASVTPAAVWHWEHHGTIPRGKTIASLAKTLGVTQDFLLTGNIDRSPTPGSSTEPSFNEISALREASLEELIKAIERKGFAVSLQSRP